MVRYIKRTLYVCQLARSEGLLIQLLLVHEVRLSAQAVNSSELVSGGITPAIIIDSVSSQICYSLIQELALPSPSSFNMGACTTSPTASDCGRIHQCQKCHAVYEGNLGRWLGKLRTLFSRSLLVANKFKTHPYSFASCLAFKNICFTTISSHPNP